MPFKRYVEVGRICLVNFGEDFGKLVVISDVLDQNRALVDSPSNIRHVETFKRLTLTSLKIDIPRLAKKAVIKAKFEEADVEGKFAASAWGKKLAARSAKAAMTDFERYRSAVARSQRNKKVAEAVKKLEKA